MVHNRMVHEAMPGHYLQLQHSRRFTGSPTAIRAALRSGSFVEGWAVYAERIMAEQGYPGDGDPRAVRMQQLKMQLRTIGWWRTARPRPGCCAPWSCPGELNRGRAWATSGRGPGPSCARRPRVS